MAKRKVNRKRVLIMVLIPILCLGILFMNMSRIRLAIKGYDAQERESILALDHKDVEDILNYSSLIDVDKWNAKTNEGHYLLYDVFHKKNENLNVQSVIYYVDAYYKNKDELDSLGYTQNILFSKSDIYTKNMLDVLLSSSIPYKSAKKYLNVKGVQVQDISSYIAYGKSAFKSVMHVSYASVDSSKQDGRVYTIINPDVVGVLVKTNYLLPADYEPKKLKTLNLPYTLENGKLVDKAADALTKMYKDASKKGYEFVVDDAYLSYDRLSTIYSSEKKANQTLIEKPGANEHQLGLSVDLTSQSVVDGVYTDFEQTPDYAWLKNNAYKYGYILRYPKNKESKTGVSDDPYHFRYVGKEMAQQIYENGWTLEDYIQKYGFTYDLRLN